MKNTVIAIFTIVLSVNIPLYAQNYFPFPDTNTAWNAVGDNEFSGSQWHFRYAVSGDTTIDEVAYSKVYKMYDSTILHPASTYFAAIRENEYKQVFCLIPGLPESILYDFSLNIGDTIWFNIGGGLCYNDVDFWELTHYRVVSDIDSVLLTNNTYRKSFQMQGNLLEDTWLEGIGSIIWYGLFNPLISDIALCGDSYEFACFKQNETVLYLNNPFCDRCFCELFTGTEKYNKSKLPIVSIHPNPANSKISISFNEVEAMEYLLIIYDAVGNKMNKLNIDQNQILEINIDNYKPGLYLLQVFSKNGNKVGSYKFIVD